MYEIPCGLQSLKGIVISVKLAESEQLRASCERYKTQTHKLEFQASELTASLKRREAQMVELENQRDEVRSFPSFGLSLGLRFFVVPMIKKKA